VDIIFHAHHAIISDRMRTRAARAIEKTAQRLSRVVDAVVRFEQDGPMRRVEIVLHAPRRRNVIARGESKFFGPALGNALERLEAQLPKKDGPKARARNLLRA
jgi:ribosome-associated translation inhibitor RaiA